MSDVTIIADSLQELESLAIVKADAAENFSVAVKEIAKKASANPKALAKLVMARVKANQDSVRDESEELIGLMDALEDRA